MTGVDQQVGAHQVRPAAQIVAAEVLELLDRHLRRLGPAVAGQVDEVQAVIDAEEIDLARAAGLVGGARQVVLADNGVDQRRLADIGAAGEGHFGQVGCRQLIDRYGAHDEDRRAGEEDAGVLYGFL